VLLCVVMEAEIVAAFVLVRQQYEEDRYVRRQRHRHVRVRVAIQNRIPAERIDRRCFDAAISVRRQVIRAQRVDGNEDDGRAGERLRRTLAAPATRDDEGGDDSDDENCDGEQTALQSVTHAAVKASRSRQIPGAPQGRAVRVMKTTNTRKEQGPESPRR